MPGIVGLITKRPRQWAEPQLLRMVAALRHEPFYRVGMWINESLGVYAGWTVIEDSFADGMPLRDPNLDLTVIFSGEEYGNRNTVEQSDERPAAYLLRLAVSDSYFPSGLDGLFHGLLADSTTGTITLFNDRYGMHRLCYHESGDTFYFAAESKAILAARPDLRTPSPQGLGEFLACSCVLENRTIFKDIAVLPAASRWIFRNGMLKQKETYFDPKEWEGHPSLDRESYYQGLRNSLAKSLPSYFDGPQRVGIALTGGMDTRVILAQHEQVAGALPTYTFGGMFHECRDVQIARKVANVCRQTHQVIEVGSEFLNRFSHYAERTVHLTEGTVDVSRASDLYVSEKARQIAPAKVVGTYGSEIVRHAVMFKPMMPSNELFCGELASSAHQAYETYAAIRRVHPVTFAAFRQSPWYHHGVLALEKTQLTVHSPFLANSFVAAVYRAPATLPPDEDIRLRLIGDGNPELRRIASDRGVGGTLGPLTSAVARAYHEFTFKAEYACDYGMPQWAAQLNHWVAPLHPERMFLGRHKFLHYRVWYRDALAGYVQQILLDPHTLSRPFWNRRNVEAMVKGHVKGNRNSTTAIHKMLTMELLFRRFFDFQSEEGFEAGLTSATLNCLTQTGGDRRAIGETAVRESFALVRSPLQSNPAACQGHLDIGLLTGGQDRHYALGLGKALSAHDLVLDVIGSDELDGPEFRGNPRLRFLNLHGNQQDANLARRISRILIFYARLFQYASTARPKIFHILWNNKIPILDRTLLMSFYKLVGKKVVLTAHNVNAARRDEKDSWLNRSTLKYQYKLADHIFVHTEKMKDELVGEFNVESKKITVIPYGINNAVPVTDLTREEARRKLGLHRDEKAILYFGAIKQYKGLEYLAAAFSQIAVRGDYRLIIAGERKKGYEEYWRSIQERIECDPCREKVLQRIEFIPDAETEVYFKGSDVAVLPYTEIFQSGILFLAYSFGLPVIATDVGSFRENVIEGTTGFICSPRSADDLTAVLERYFASALFRELKERRSQIRHYAMAAHSWEVVGKITHDVYTGLLVPSKNGRADNVLGGNFAT